MRILLAAATSNEINLAEQWIEKESGGGIEVVITGIGGTAAAYALTKAILQTRPGLVIQAGIGGSFKDALPPGSLAFISEEVTADLGAMEKGVLIDLFDMGFERSDEHPFTSRMLVNPWQESFAHFDLPFVRGATINAVSSTPEQVNRIQTKYAPAIESMEGSALHYVCLKENVPFIQLRAVSNMAGQRDKSKWMIRESVARLNEKLQSMLIKLLPQEALN